MLFTFNGCNENDISAISQEEGLVENRSSENYYYDLLFNDTHYRSLVSSFDSKNYDPDFSKRSNIEAVVADSNMKEIRKIWKDKLPKDGKEKGIALDQFLRATNDLQLLNHQDQISAFPCPDGSIRNYGRFDYSLQKLDCEEIVEAAEDMNLNGVCCARLYCNEVNCLVDVYRRFTNNSTIVLDGEPFKKFISFWYQQKENPLFVAIGLVTAADAFVAAVTVQIGSGIVIFVDLILSSFACHLSDFEGDNIENKCNCDCPSFPECNTFNNTIFGGFTIPEDCE